MLYERKREGQEMLLSYCTLPFLSPQICSWCRDCQSGASHFKLSLCLLPGNFNFGTFYEVYTSCMFPSNYTQGEKHSYSKPTRLDALPSHCCRSGTEEPSNRRLVTTLSTRMMVLGGGGGAQGVRRSGFVRGSTIILVTNKYNVSHY